MIFVAPEREACVAGSARVTPTRDQFTGCLLGLALGDAFGAPYEGGLLERALWRAIGRTPSGAMRYTDDTQMSLDLAESLIANGRLDLADVATRFATSYRWSRGYGPGAAKVLKRIRAGAGWEAASRSVYPEGSFGNGGAMRAPVVGLAYWRDRAQLLNAAQRSAKITHAHPLAIEGAAIVALATASALTAKSSLEILEAAEMHASSPNFVERLSLSRRWLEASADCSPTEVRTRLGMGIVATQSCITGVYLALRFLEQPLETLLSFVASCGGDVDTVGAMAGAIWGAFRGEAKLPAALLEKLENRERIGAVARSLYEADERSV